MYRKLNINELAYRGFIVVVVALGLIVLVQGVGAALGLIDEDHEIVWMDTALTLLTGLALLAGIWIIERWHRGQFRPAGISLYWDAGLP